MMLYLLVVYNALGMYSLNASSSAMVTQTPGNIRRKKMIYKTSHGKKTSPCGTELASDAERLRSSARARRCAIVAGN